MFFHLIVVVFLVKSPLGRIDTQKEHLVGEFTFILNESKSL